MSEITLMREVLCTVSALSGALFWRQNVGGDIPRRDAVVQFGIAGCPEILASYRSRFRGIKVTRPTGQQSKQRRRFQQAFERAGSVYVLARSVDDALAALKAVP